jgi:hypothetical protein
MGFIGAKSSRRKFGTIVFVAYATGEPKAVETWLPKGNRFDSVAPAPVMPARCYILSTQGRRIRGPRNPVQLLAVATHPHMHASRSL